MKTPTDDQLRTMVTGNSDRLSDEEPRTGTVLERVATAAFESLRKRRGRCPGCGGPFPPRGDFVVRTGVGVAAREYVRLTHIDGRTCEFATDLFAARPVARRQGSTLQRFESRVEPEPNTGCRLWTAGTNRDGYGQFMVDGRSGTAHRAAWRLQVGPIPRGLHVLHRCDVPSCGKEGSAQ